MYKIIKKTVLAPNVTEFVFYAPAVVRHAQPGQFVMLRVHENGERVPFTIVKSDKALGELTLLIQTVGYTTMLLGGKNVGDSISDIAGPLGQGTELHGDRLVLIGGGIGTAVIYPQAEALFKQGKAADVIVGARSKELVMYEDELRAVARNLYITTDDGSYIRKGFVTDVLTELLLSNVYDTAFAVGPPPMMRAVCRLTKERGLSTVVSLNSLMVDGTGMCGCCRVTVGGVTKYSCVDGPEFDGHQIDWAEVMSRSKIYSEIEKAHICRLTGERKL